MKRKIYNDILKWKNESNGATALLIEGARRVGKSYITEHFAKENYKSYILIDFSKVSKEIIELFNNYLDIMYSIIDINLYTKMPEKIAENQEKIRLSPYDYCGFGSCGRTVIPYR